MYCASRALFVPWRCSTLTGGKQNAPLLRNGVGKKHFECCFSPVTRYRRTGSKILILVFNRTFSKTTRLFSLQTESLGPSPIFAGNFQKIRRNILPSTNRNAHVSAFFKFVQLRLFFVRKNLRHIRMHGDFYGSDVGTLARDLQITNRVQNHTFDRLQHSRTFAERTLLENTAFDTRTNTLPRHFDEPKTRA